MDEDEAEIRRMRDEYHRRTQKQKFDAKKKAGEQRIARRSIAILLKQRANETKRRDKGDGRNA